MRSLDCRIFKYTHVHAGQRHSSVFNRTGVLMKKLTKLAIVQVAFSLALLSLKFWQFMYHKCDTPIDTDIELSTMNQPWLVVRALD